MIEYNDLLIFVKNGILILDCKLSFRNKYILKTVFEFWDACYYVISNFLHFKSTLVVLIYFYPVQYSYIKLTGFIDHFTKRSLLVRHYIPIFLYNPHQL